MPIGMRRANNGLIVLAALCTIRCGGGYSSSPAPTIVMSGTWSGIVGQAMSGAALRLTWQVMQTGGAVTGSASLVKPAVNVPANATLTGTLNGNQLALTFSAPAGSVQGFSSCAISGSGSATATNSTVTGTLDLTFTSCAGTGLEPTGNSQLSLTKQ
jgi:hypothetical protein